MTLVEKSKVLMHSYASPVITNKVCASDFDEDNAVIIPANIPSKDLGIVNTEKGMKGPKWFVLARKNKNELLVIDGIDTIDEYMQEKFFELVKYKTISSVEFHVPIRIIITCTDVQKVSKNLASLCQIVV